MTDPARRFWDFYLHKPDAGLIQEENFGLFGLERWKKEGHIDDNTDLNRLFGYEPQGKHVMMEAGWTEPAFSPVFENKVVEDRGDYEVVQDVAGRTLLCFKGRRVGFMPEYLSHAVQDRKTWEQNVKWRLDPRTPQRYETLNARMDAARAARSRGFVIIQRVIGGYMYLRALMGPEKLLYMFYDDPALVHDCMKAWFALADRICEVHGSFLDFDELFIGEDICYKTSALISPDMMREFLFPYYEQLIANISKRRHDKSLHLYFEVDTDGHAPAVIDLYRSIGMDYMSPFEAAAGCDVVAIRRKYPDLLMRGGFDKRILAAGPDAIDREIDRIMPFMKRCGGYLPSCDHAVPAEVSFDNYMHFRRRLLEFA